VTGDLVAFLRARLDDDEQVAQEAAKMAGGQRWAARYHVITQMPEPGRAGDTIAECAPFGGRYVAKHIGRHDPERVLAEVDAKRRIVDRLDYWETNASRAGVAGLSNFERGTRAELLATCRLLALPYADHPDYQPEWTP